LQKYLSTEILLIYPRESGGTGFRACADKGLNLNDIILKFFIKMILKPEACHCCIDLQPAFAKAGKPVPPAYDEFCKSLFWQTLWVNFWPTILDQQP
jgi:hypothetical protein